jgi:hypothetical protein
MHDASPARHNLAPAQIGHCESCAELGRLNARICRTCQARFGRRIAELIARARRDADFASRCLAAMGPEARAALLEILERPHREPAARSTAAALRPGLRKCESKPNPRLHVVRSTRSA